MITLETYQGRRRVALSALKEVKRVDDIDGIDYWRHRLASLRRMARRAGII